MACPHSSGPGLIPNRSLSGRGGLGAVVAAVIALAACSDTQHSIGANCDGPEQCSTGLCYYGQCLNPAGDEDNDGLTNELEARLGSDPFNTDTDNDGIADRDELGPAFERIDSDGDGKPDIIESILADADGDCIVDQLDADDANPNDDLTPMVALVCSFDGICGVQSDRLRARCPDGASAVCDYGLVEGWSEAETACDGRDENCDGQVDEGLGECQPKSMPMKPFIGVVSGAGSGGNAQYRARIVVGPPLVGSGTGQDRTVRMGAAPAGTFGTATTEVP